MYEESRRKKASPTSSPREPKDTRKIYYIVGGVISFVFIAVAFFVFYQSRTIGVVEMPALEDCARTIEGFREGELQVIICVRSDGTLLLFWENLPKGTETINIYRADAESGEWGLWRSISISGTSGGVEIGIEGPGSFAYYFEAKNEGGESTWVSKNAPIESARTGDDTTAGAGDDSDNDITHPTDSIPPPSPPADDTDNTPPPIDNDTLPPPPPSDEEGAYYTPDGQLVSPNPIDLGDFWVQHVNKRIEIGWKNLLAGTDSIVVDRSKTQSGGYSQFLEITNPLPADSLHLVDNTINEAYYYKMTALGGTSILDVFGPEFLPALEE